MATSHGKPTGPPPPTFLKGGLWKGKGPPPYSLQGPHTLLPRKGGPTPPRCKGKKESKGTPQPIPADIGTQGAVSCGDEGVIPLFDSTAECVFYIDSKKWTSTEQFYHASKFADDHCREKIRLTTHADRKAEYAKDLFTMAQAMIGTRDPAFHHLETMYIATNAKFQQNPEERRQLLESHGNLSPIGINSDWHCMSMWQHWHTRVLERVRLELQVAARVNPLAPSEAEKERKLEAELEHAFLSMNFDEDRVARRLQQIMQEYEAMSTPLHLLGSSLGGDQIDVHVRPSDPISSICIQCADAVGLAARNIRILFRGVKLQPDKFVYEVGFVEGDDFEVLIVKNLLQVSAIGRRGSGQTSGDFLSEIREGVQLWPVDLD